MELHWIRASCGEAVSVALDFYFAWRVKAHLWATALCVLLVNMVLWGYAKGEWRGNVVGGVVEGYRLRSSLLVWAADWAGYPFAQNPYRIIKHVIYKAASSSRGQQHSLHDPSYLGINLLSVWKSHQSSKKHGCYRLWRWRCFIEKRKNFYSIPHRVFIDTQKEKEKERWAWEVQNVKSFSQPRSCCINLVILQCVPSSRDLHIYIIRLQKEL